MVEMAAVEDEPEEAEQLQPSDVGHHRDVQQPVARVGAGTDLHPATEVGGVPDREEGGPIRVGRPVDMEDHVAAAQTR
ncbi:MAG: hypothetical protein R2695_05560 [Acidimicrobiales bacterium]